MSAPSREEQDSLIAQFSAFVGPQADAEQAQTFLENSNWNVESAVQTFFAAADGHDQDMQDDEPTQAAGSASATPAAPVPVTGPRTLDGRPAPVDESSSFGKAASSSTAKSTQRVGGLRTLKDFQSSSGGHGHGHGHDDDDDDDEDDHHPDQDLYAGGEKSGLAVENPGQSSDPQAAIRNMIKRAGRDQARPGGEDSERPRSRFTGTGQTLGGDDTPSVVVTQGTPQTQQRPAGAEPERRDLHIWRDGFSVDDGPLYRYDDPANRRYLDLINRGQAPTELLNVQPGAEVDVHLDLHREEDYVKPKAKYKPFSGSGNRLGSPVPGAASSLASSSTTTAAPASSTAGTSSAASSGDAVKVDDSQPTVLLQIRLGDGTRLRSRFNTTHTVGDIYALVNASNTESASRSWALMTTFPTKELSDKSATLGDIPELKKGGSVVQKWT